MDERERIRDFAARLDNALHGEEQSHPAEGDDQTLIALAQTLAATDLSQESTRLGLIGENLYRRAALAESVVRRPAPFRVAARALAVSVLLCLVLAAAVLAIPPLRGLAQDILAQIGFLVFTDAPTDFEVFRQTPTPPPFVTPVPSAMRQVFEMQLRPAEEVSTLVGFTMSTPDYVPDGYRLVGRDAWLATGQNAALSTYYNAAADDSLNIQQTLIHDGQTLEEFGVGDASVTRLTVRGVPGVWVEHYAVWPGVGLNTLVWEERGFLFWLHSAHLSRGEMLRVAESLRP